MFLEMMKNNILYSIFPQTKYFMNLLRTRTIYVCSSSYCMPSIQANKTHVEEAGSYLSIQGNPSEQHYGSTPSSLLFPCLHWVCRGISIAKHHQQYHLQKYSKHNPSVNNSKSFKCFSVCFLLEHDGEPSGSTTKNFMNCLITIHWSRMIMYHGVSWLDKSLKESFKRSVIYFFTIRDNHKVKFLNFSLKHQS